VGVGAGGGELPPPPPQPASRESAQPMAAVRVKSRNACIRLLRTRGSGCKPSLTPRHTKLSAATVPRIRISDRSPGKVSRRVSIPSSPCANAIHTVPTGFSSDPPSGPATPVVEIARSVPSRLRAPRAIATATSSLTAPTRASVSSGTSSRAVFTSLAYATMLPRKTFEAPGTATISSATAPPVNDSAVPIVQP